MARDFENIFDTDDLDDGELRRLVREVLRDNRMVDPDDITVHVRDGRVILTGRVGTDAAKRIAERVVSDRIGLPNLESQLVVDELRRPHSPEAVDEHLADEADHEGLLLGERPSQQEPSAEHLVRDDDAGYYGTVDRMAAIEGGEPWIPPEGPTPEGTDERGYPSDRERDSF